MTTPPLTATPGPPAVIGMPSICVTVSASPSTSLSLPRTAIVMGVSSVAAKVSATATGASLTGVTLPPTVAVEVRPEGSVTV